MDVHMKSLLTEAIAGTEDLYTDTDLESYSGLESFTSSPTTTGLITYKQVGSQFHPHLALLMNEKMCGGQEQYQKRRAMATRLLISTKDSMNFNLYITEVTEFDNPEWQNKFCKLLRTLTDAQTLHVYTGNFAYGAWPVYSLGALLDAMSRTAGRVITHINGRSSFGETVLWMYGHERYISEFGTLMFIGLQKHLECTPMYHSYFRTLYKKAKELNILTQAEIEDCMTSNKCLQLTYTDVINRINAKQTDVESEKPLDTPM